MMRLSHYNGNPYVGVYCAVNEDLAFVPRDVSDNLSNDLKIALNVEIVKCSIAGTHLIGSLLSMNSAGAVVSNMTSDSELEYLSRYIPAYRIQDKVNASGNNILANDRGAIANPELAKKTVRSIQDTLGVEVVQSAIAEHNTVGSVCVATNKGVLCHPATRPEELDLIRRSLKVPAAIGTLNYGAPMIGACMVANSKGAAIGYKSTPIELGRVEDALDLI